jgi:hypothetical protein
MFEGTHCGHRRPWLSGRSFTVFRREFNGKLVDFQVKTLDFTWVELPGISHRNLPFHGGHSLCFYVTDSENQAACRSQILGSLRKVMNLMTYHIRIHYKITLAALYM